MTCLRDRGVHRVAPKCGGAAAVVVVVVVVVACWWWWVRVLSQLRQAWSNQSGFNLTCFNLNSHIRINTLYNAKLS